MSFHLVWYAFIFPNVGFTLAVIKIGEKLLSPAIQWVGSIMTIILIAMWLFVMALHFRATVNRQIMMPTVDEDKG